LALALLACGRGRSTRCSLSEATLVTKAEVARYDDIATVLAEHGAHAIWSNRLGLFAKPLHAKAARPVQLAEAPCSGGVAALGKPELLVACARPAGDGAEDGALWLYGGVYAQRTVRSLAKLGRDAHGVAMAGDGTRAYVAYADGEVGGPRVQLALLTPGTTPTPLSLPAQNGREPALVVVAGVPIVAFATSELGPTGPAHHRLMISRAGELGSALLDVQTESPLPALAVDGDSIVLAFRDRPRPKARNELYVARLDAKTLRVAQKPRAIGRANGQAGPSLALCKNTRVVALPIDHAGELFIAFNPLSAELATPEANHQYYENEHEFVQSETICLNGYPLTLIAERTEANRPEARLLAAEFRCQQ
jgi:hypothetical protein